MKTLTFFSILILFTILSSVSFSQWVQTGGPFGANVNSVAKMDSDIYAGVNDGIYISHNEGQSWLKSSLINSYKCDEILSFNDTVIIVYDKSISNADSVLSITSFNGGISWSNPAIVIPDNGPSNQISVAKIKSTIVIEGHTQTFTSFDYGISWAVINYPPFGNYINSYTADSNRILLWMVNDTTYKSKYYVSSDGTLSWQFVSNGDSVYETFISDSVILYAVYDTAYNFSMVRTTNFGTSWDTVYHAPTGYSIGYYEYYNGDYYTFTYQNQSPNTMNNLVSHDKGQTWSSTVMPSKYMGIDFLNIAVHLTNGDLLGRNWTNGVTRYIPSLDTFFASNTGIKEQGINFLGAYHNELYTSASDGFYNSIDAGLTWQKTSLPVTYVAGMLYHGDTLLCLSNGFTNYLERSFDNGLTWDSIRVPVTNTWQDYVSITEIGSRIFVSTDSILYTDDLGASWHTLAPLNGVYPHDQSGYIKVLNNNLFSVSNDGGIYRYNQFSFLWDSIYGFSSPGAHNGNYLYIVDSTLVMAGRDALLYTNGNGNSWTQAALNGLPIVNFYPVTPRSIVETNGLWIGAAGSYGVYVTGDRGNNWVQIQSGAPPFSAAGLTIMNNVLYSGSYISSVWRRAGTFIPLSGVVYHDLNNNGIRDSGEAGIPNIVLQLIPTGWVASTDTSGHYALATDAIGDTLKPFFPLSFATITPSYYITSGAAANLDFGIYIQPNIADLAVDVTNVNVFRRGFSTDLNITSSNLGSLVQSAKIQLVLDSELFFISSIPSPDTIIFDTLTWNTSPLNFLDVVKIRVTTLTSSVASLGDTIHCFTIINPVVNDTFPADNYSELTGAVKGSFDPNEKECSQGDYFSTVQLTNREELVFTIRFQNTGSFTADSIHIRDTLSSYLDLSSFRVISNSHPMQWSLSGNGIADFYFAHINLPPSTTNELNSHGYVKYGIHCKPNDAVGNSITNMASIYFDFNSPVQTNTTSTLITFPVLANLNDSHQNQVSNIVVYPNPTSAILTIDLTKSEYKNVSMTIFNSIGSIVKSLQLQNLFTSISINDLADGLYLGSLINKEGQTIGTFRFIISKN